MTPGRPAWCFRYSSERNIRPHDEAPQPRIRDYGKMRTRKYPSGSTYCVVGRPTTPAQPGRNRHSPNSLPNARPDFRHTIDTDIIVHRFPRRYTRILQLHRQIAQRNTVPVQQIDFRKTCSLRQDRRHLGCPGKRVKKFQ